jgi:hypothetical protein
MLKYQDLRLAAGTALTAAIVAFALGGCAGEQTGPGKGAAQVWAENCNRCHNYRPPGEFSDAQWDVIVHHMRVRANLTAKEHQTIVEFLKASN